MCTNPVLFVLPGKQPSFFWATFQFVLPGCKCSFSVLFLFFFLVRGEKKKIYNILLLREYFMQMRPELITPNAKLIIYSSEKSLYVLVT